jgi:hypothetical protein
MAVTPQFTHLRQTPRAARCVVLTRDLDDALSVARAPRSLFIVVDQLPLPAASGAYALPCSGHHGYGSTINAQVGGTTATIAWRLRSGDPARRLVNIIVDSPNPGAVVQAATHLFIPAPPVDISLTAPIPSAVEVQPLPEEPLRRRRGSYPRRFRHQQDDRRRPG